MSVPQHWTIGDQVAPLRVQQGRPGRIQLKVRNGILEVYTPDGTFGPEAENLLRAREHKLYQYLQVNRQRLAQQDYWRERMQQEVRLFGSARPIHWLHSKQYRYRLQAGRFEIGAPQPPTQAQTPALLKAALRELGKQYLLRRTHHWAEQTGLKPAQVRIKHVKSRWGSCSSKRNINLNWHLMLLEKPLIDYVIVHELTHLVELNHSPRFWRLVQQHYPHYKTADKALDSEQWVIGLYD